MVMRFRAVVGKIIELPRSLGTLGHQLPIADADRPIAFVFPKERSAPSG